MTLIKRKINIPIFTIGLLFSIYMIEYMVNDYNWIYSLPKYVNNFLYLIVAFWLFLKNKSNSKQLLVLIIAIICFMITFSQTGFTELIRSVLLLFLMSKVNFDDLVIHLRKMSFAFLIINFFFVAVNFLFRVTDTKWYGALPLLMFLLPFLRIIEKHGKLLVLEKIILLLLSLSSYFFGIQKTALVLTVLAILLCGSNIYNKISKLKIFRWSLYLLPGICFLCSLISAYQYPKNSIIQMLDFSIFNHRFMMNYRSLLRWPPSLFGRTAEGMYTSIGNFYDPVTNTWSTFNTVDNVYIILLINMGIIAIIIIGFAYVFLAKKILKNKRIDIALICMMLCIDGLFESNVSSLFISFPFFYLFAIDNASGIMKNSNN